MDVSLIYLQRFATKVSRAYTDRPVKVILTDLPKTTKYKVVARSATNRFYPDDKRYKPYAVSYEVFIDNGYYNENKHNPEELKQAVIHEIAHLISDETATRKNRGKHTSVGHGQEFKKIARTLGADTNHLRQYWD